jgi:hypothetical protein
MTQIKAILSFFQRGLNNMFEGLIQARQKQVEAYLARSVDLADLERRMKEVSKEGISYPRW